MKKQLEKENNKLYYRAEKYVLREIQKTCKRYGWVFKTVYGITLYKKPNGLNDGIEIDDSRLHKLVYWFEENFGNFGLYVCDRGDFIEGQTTLIQFNIPKL